VLNVLATGTLVGDPKQRTGATGKPYVTAQARVPCDGEDSLLLSIIAFRDSARDALLALAQGDAVAVTGRAKLTAWRKNGEERHGLSVVAEQVLTAYQVEKRRSASTRGKAEQGEGLATACAPSPAPARRASAAASAAQDGGAVADMVDDLPF